MPFASGLGDHREHPIGSIHPQTVGLLGQFLHHPLITAEPTHVEKRCCGLQVGRRQVERFVDGANRMTKLDPGVPHRIPNPFGHLGDGSGTVVYQE